MTTYRWLFYAWPDRPWDDEKGWHDETSYWDGPDIFRTSYWDGPDIFRTVELSRAIEARERYRASGYATSRIYKSVQVSSGHCGDA